MNRRPLEGSWKRRTEWWRARMRALTRIQPAATRTAGAGAPAALRPAGVTGSTWDEAFTRVESYLCAHHIESRELLNRRTTEIITEARQLAQQRPHEDPVQLSMNVLQLRLGAWFVRTLGEGDWADERFRARGRLALFMAQIPRTAAAQVLTHEPLPAALIEKARAAHLQPGPEVRLSNMPPAPLDFVVGDAQAPGWQQSSRASLVRAAAASLMAVVLLGAVTWAASQ